MSKWKIKIKIGVDLGTTSTKIYIEKEGFIFEIPTVIAIHKKTEKIVAFGEEAEKMLGRAPQYLEVIRPVLNGIVVHFDEAMMFLELVLKETLKKYIVLFRPTLIVSVPQNLTEVQKRGVIEVVKNSGAKDVFLIEEPVAAALGANLDIDFARGIFITDIGGGTTEIAILSMGGVVVGKSLRIGGDSFNQAIIEHIKEKYNIVIGERQAEEIKINIATIHPRPEKSYLVKGRDIISGLPKEVLFTGQDLRESLEENLSTVALAMKDLINVAPPDLLKDISFSGLFLTGGGSLIEGLDSYFEKEIKMPVTVVDDPKHAVIRGIGRLIENFGHYQKLLINV
jgi:rod shape-determining protein MreB